MRRALAFVALMLGLVSATVRPADAAVDLTGDWSVVEQSIVGPLNGTFTFVQSGTQLDLTYTIQGGAPQGPYTGTIDPDAGTFDIPLPPTMGAITCNGNQIIGSASPDGQTISGTWTAYFVSIHLFCQDGGGPFTGARARCGNGFIDGSDVCDDGNTVDGDCCSADCSTAAPDATPCDDGNPCTTPDQCSGGSCTSGTPLTCEPCEACSPSGCIIPEDDGCQPVLAGGKSKIFLRHQPGAPEKDALAWSWKNGLPMSVADFGSPPADHSYYLCVIDRSGGVPTLRMRRVVAAGGMCGTKACWKTLPKGFTYTDKAAPGGLTKLALGAGAAGHGKIAAKGKGALLAVPAGFMAPLTVRLVRDGASICWDATYSSPQGSDGTIFRSKSD